MDDPRVEEQPFHHRKRWFLRRSTMQPRDTRDSRPDSKRRRRLASSPTLRAPLIH